MSDKHETQDQAVLKIMFDLGADADRLVLLEDLKSVWAGHRNRHQDLIESVRRMIFGGLLLLTHTNAGSALSLTPQGRQRTGALRHHLSSLWQPLAAAFAAAFALPAAPHWARMPF